MKLTVYILLSLVLLTGAGAIFFKQILALWVTPNYPFNVEKVPVAPDYKYAKYWAASPSKEDHADMVVAGQTNNQRSAPVDVFYIHPTAYYGRDNWNSDMDPEKSASQVIDFMLAAHASIFNGCCKIYAPHFREAHIRSFAKNEGPVYQALDLAYSDVKRAFEYFLTYQNKGRPFILVGHSQGTAHGLRLLEDYIEPNKLTQQMIAAYLIGYEVPLDKFTPDRLQTPLCDTPSQINCLISWATFGESGETKQEFDVIHWYPEGWQSSLGKDTVCINPLSWDKSVPASSKDAHLGAVSTGDFSFFLKSALLNKHTGIQPSSLTLYPQHTHAKCENGRLLVAMQKDNAFSKGTSEKKQNYHGVDMNLFYLNIRQNAANRIAHYRQSLLTGR